MQAVMRSSVTKRGLLHLQTLQHTSAVTALPLQAVQTRHLRYFLRHWNLASASPLRKKKEEKRFFGCVSARDAQLLWVIECSQHAPCRELPRASRFVKAALQNMIRLCPLW